MPIKANMNWERQKEFMAARRRVTERNHGEIKGVISPTPTEPLTVASKYSGVRDPDAYCAKLRRDVWESQQRRKGHRIDVATKKG